LERKKKLMIGERFYVGKEVPDYFEITNLYTVHYFDNYKDYAFKGESHAFWEIDLLDSGKIITVLNDETTVRKFILNQGSLLIIPPGTYHNFFMEEKDAHFNLFVISFSCESPAMNLFLDHPQFDYNPSYNALAAKILKEARQALVLPLGEICADQMNLQDDAPFGALQMIKTLLQQLLILLTRNVMNPGKTRWIEPTSRSNIPYVQKAIEFLHANLTNRITLKEVCDEAGMSESQLQKTFTHEMGKSVMRYLRILRIEYAKYLIRMRKSSLSEIAETLTFRSVHHFSTCFKSITEVSPSNYIRTLEAQCPDAERGLPSLKDQMDAILSE